MLAARDLDDHVRDIPSHYDGSQALKKLSEIKEPPYLKPWLCLIQASTI